MATESPIDGKRLQFVSGFIGKNLIQKSIIFIRKLTRKRPKLPWSSEDRVCNSRQILSNNHNASLFGGQGYNKTIFVGCMKVTLFEINFYDT